MTQYEQKFGRFFLLLSILLLSCSICYSQSSSRVERKADRLFLHGDYEKSMRYYERGLSRLSSDDASYSILELKIAQLYSLLQDKPNTISHYNSVFSRVDSLLSIDDIYLFTDALRRSDMHQQAEKVIRHYAFRGDYQRNQRFMNTLNSLSNQSYYYQKGLTNYDVRRLDTVSMYSNYWIGEYDSQPFFAQSRSDELTSNDKIIYHQTRYRKFGNNLFDEDMVFNDIPQQLQQGAMAYNKASGLLIVTDISYQGSDRKNFNSVINQGFCSTLHYSRYNSKSGRWAAFAPLFDNAIASINSIDGDVNSKYSYAHPSFFNDGKSLIFSSDRPDGYGGMDLYVTHWDEPSGKWGNPENLGTQVNSEGDELYAHIYGEALFFASNGFEGFGGFDNYRISFGDNIILPGTLFHYPYPVNSAYNDFGVYFHKGNGFFISDRQENGRDDIYVLIDAPTSLSRDGAIGVSKEYTAMRGNLGVVEQMASGNTLERRSDVNLREFVDKTAHAQMYFDFDSKRLTATTKEDLDELLNGLTVDDIDMISVIGYSDLIGSVEYNKHLSLDRAEVVAKYLMKHLAGVTIEYQGNGVVKIPEREMDEIEAQIRAISNNDSHYEHIDVQRSPIIRGSNRQTIIDLFESYRRVEIVIKNKHNYNK